MKTTRIFYIIQISWASCENIIYVKDSNSGKVCIDYNEAEKFDDILIAENATRIAFKQIAKKEDEPFLIKPLMIRETFEIIDPYVIQHSKLS